MNVTDGEFFSFNAPINGLPQDGATHGKRNEKRFSQNIADYRAVARKKLQPRRTHGPLYEISRMKSSNIISLIKKIKIDSIW